MNSKKYQEKNVPPIFADILENIDLTKNKHKKNIELKIGLNMAKSLILQRLIKSQENKEIIHIEWEA